MSDINHLGPLYRPNRLSRASREAVRHSAAVPEVASPETMLCASANSRSVAARPVACHRGMGSGCLYNAPHHRFGDPMGGL